LIQEYLAARSLVLTQIKYEKGDGWVFLKDAPPTADRRSNGIGQEPEISFRRAGLRELPGGDEPTPDRKTRLRNGPFRGDLPLSEMWCHDHPLGEKLNAQLSKPFRKLTC